MHVFSPFRCQMLRSHPVKAEPSCRPFGQETVLSLQVAMEKPVRTRPGPAPEDERGPRDVAQRRLFGVFGGFGPAGLFDCPSAAGGCNGDSCGGGRTDDGDEIAGGAAAGVTCAFFSCNALFISRFRIHDRESKSVLSLRGCLEVIVASKPANFLGRTGLGNSLSLINHMACTADETFQI